MIFITPVVESIVQVKDQTRISAKYAITPDEEPIATIEIRPDIGENFYEVSNESLDWAYSSNGDKEATIRITTSATTPVVVEETAIISVLTEAEDNLFSSDADILAFESELYEYLRAGRASWLDKHRAAQSVILDELASKGFTKSDGTNFTKSDTFSDDFKKWSTFLVLETIFEEISNATDDVFAEKSNRYKSKKIMAKDRATLSLDIDGDGTVESNEKVNIFSTEMVRR